MKPIVMLVCLGVVGCDVHVSVSTGDSQPNSSNSSSTSWRERKVASKEELGEAAYRLDERPGNYEILNIIYDFIHGLHGIEPEMRNVAYPLVAFTKTVESEAVWKEALESYKAERIERGDSDGPTNELRGMNFNVKSIQFLRVGDSQPYVDDEDITDDEIQNITDLINMCREHHSGLAYFVRARIAWESLRSDKKHDFPNYSTEFLVVRKPEGWRIVYFHDMTFWGSAFMGSDLFDDK